MEDNRLLKEKGNESVSPIKLKVLSAILNAFPFILVLCATILKAFLRIKKIIRL